MAETKTKEQLADDARRDVMAFAYRDKDGKLYTINEKGQRIEAAVDARALAPEFQKIADQVAAILMIQSKVLSISPEERTIITQIMEGNAKDRAKLGKTAVEAVKNAAAVFGYDYSPEEGTFSSIVSGFKAPFVAVKDTWNAAGDILNQIGGGELSRENALAFGTAYASARQAARVSRPNNAGALDYVKAGFSKDFFAYVIAAIQFGFDKIKGLCGFECTNKTFDQYLDENLRPADNRRVLHELTKLPKIGGLDTKETGGQLTNDGEGLSVTGNKLTVKAANADSPAPQATGPDGSPAPSTPDAAEAFRNAQRKGLVDRLALAAKSSDFSHLTDTVKNADPVWLTVGIGSALGATAQTVRGVREGLVREGVNAVGRASKAAAEAAETAGEKVTALRSQITNHGDAKPSPLGKVLDSVRSDAQKAAAETAREQAHAKHLNDLQKALGEAEKAEQLAASKADKAKAAFEAIPESKVVKAAEASKKIEGGFLKTLFVDSWRMVGRKTGDLVVRGKELVGNLQAKEAEALSKVHAHNAEVLAKTAENVGKFVKSGSRVLRWIPGIGAVGAAGGVFFATSARADTVNGEKLNYYKQLEHDHKLGKINDKEYAYYRGLQATFIASGVGGFITAGVVEAAQNGLEYADPIKMDKYLPESIVATVKGLIKSDQPTGALPADAALSKVAAEATQKAEQARVAAVAAQSADAMEQARMAANRGLAFAKVSSNERVGTVPSQATPAGSRVAAVGAAIAAS